MKRIQSIIHRTILFSVVLGVAAGCEADRNALPDPAQRPELTFSAAIAGPDTRAGDTDWDSGDAIGVFMTDVPGGAILDANKRYVASAAGGLFNAATESDRIELPEGATVDLWAYYPHDPATAGFVVPVDITDQSDQSRLDLMHASVTGVSGFETPPAFTFGRRMARFTFNVTAGQGIASLGGLRATVSEAPTLATFDAKSGLVSVNSGSVAPFEGKVTVSGKTAKVEITVLPGSKPTVAFTLAGHPFVWKADVAAIRGDRYTYSVTLTDKDGPVIVTPANRYLDTPVLPEGGTPGTPPAGSKATKYLTFPGTDLIYYEVDFPDRAGRNYQMLYDSKELIARWVSYPLYKSIMSVGNRTDDFDYDPNIERNLQQNLNRSYGGYDRGHQMPSADRNYNTTVNRTTFYYTNMTPQVSSMNQGIWSQLEDSGVRPWARECDTLYVVTGASLTTLTDKTIKHVSDNDGKQVGLPKYYFKALAKRYNNGTADPSDDRFYTIAFKIDNAAVSGSYDSYRLTVADLERETGFSFFPQLPDPSIKATINSSEW